MRLESMQPTKPAAPTPLVFIVSEGLKDRPTYTMHKFVDSVLVPDPDKGWLHPQWDVMYRCTVTNVQRKFGCVDATSITEDEQKLESGLA